MVFASVELQLMASCMQTLRGKHMYLTHTISRCAIAFLLLVHSRAYRLCMYKYARKCADTHARMHTRTHAHAHTCERVHVGASSCTQTRSHIQACLLLMAFYIKK